MPSPDSLKLPSLGCFGDLRVDPETEDDRSPENDRSFTIVVQSRCHTTDIFEILRLKSIK